MSHPEGPSVLRGSRLMMGMMSLGVKLNCKMDSKMLAHDLIPSGKLIQGQLNGLSTFF